MYVYFPCFLYVDGLAHGHVKYPCVLRKASLEPAQAYSRLWGGMSGLRMIVKEACNEGSTGSRLRDRRMRWIWNLAEGIAQAANTQICACNSGGSLEKREKVERRSGGAGCSKIRSCLVRGLRRGDGAVGKIPSIAMVSGPGSYSQGYWALQGIFD